MAAKSNFILIGMPGSGKSTIGVILAKRTSHDFIDTDVLIQSMQGRSLQDILDREGYLKLREIEAAALQGLNVKNSVISTGGSAVYSDAAMRHLKQDGVMIYLDVSLATLRSRITDYDTRGIAKRPEQSFDDLFLERTLLYRQYADLTLCGDGLNQDQVCERLIAALQAL
ncbi:MAG: shikimate kinase [Pseudomonadales bacterium]|jgi:shikimate kinase|nr:shikimate kinase [Pseudomonadales bacterium]